jgi:hypothetical protein
MVNFVMINGYNQVSVSSIENFNIMVRLMMNMEFQE